MKKQIVIRLQIEGLHCWPEAADYFPKVRFLADPHRHTFFIEIHKVVTHNDRDIEIILFKREVEDYIKQRFYDESMDVIDFGRRSCEDIAELLLVEFDAGMVQVLEDNENGAKITSE